VQDYDLPSFVGQNTLLICSSYSGNTEETVSVLEQTLSRETRPMIIVVASGGKLQELAQSNNLPYVQLPGGFQPRYTFGYQYRALTEILAAAGLADGYLDVVAQAGEALRAKIAGWIPTVPTASNQAKEIAQELMGKSVVVYAGPKLASAAYKWKISCNENAKHIAWWNQYPELNHNEFLGWTKQPEQKPYAVLELRSSFEHERVQKRFDVTGRLLSGMRPSPIRVEPTGETLVDHLLSTVALGDFVSIYLAILGNINPTPVDLIEKFKTEMSS